MPSELTLQARHQGGMRVLAEAFELAETQLCPVWAMFRGSTPISTRFTLEEA